MCIRDRTAAFLTIETQYLRFFIAHSNRYDALALFIAVAVQITDDLRFQVIFVTWLDNTVWIAAFEIDMDMVAAIGNGSCLAVIDLPQLTAVFIFLEPVSYTHLVST